MPRLDTKKTRDVARFFCFEEFVHLTQTSSLDTPV